MYMVEENPIAKDPRYKTKQTNKQTLSQGQKSSPYEGLQKLDVIFLIPLEFHLYT